ncbi:MAG: hypothetical protein H7A38_05090 [Chlamydiales bacterium]|nr:hypothetical protein [Chlamydiales bacterium]
MRQLLFLTGCFLTIFNIVNADVFSQKLSDRSEQISRNEFLAEIETQYAECVNEYTEDKIYINSSAIRSTSGGIFLQNKGIPNMIQKLVFGCVCFTANFLPSLAPCARTMVARSRQKICAAALPNSQLLNHVRYKGEEETRQLVATFL